MSLKAILLLLFALSMDWSFAQNETPDKLKGHILFFMPLSPQSAKIAFMPVAEKLIERDHKVTLVTPYKSNIKNSNFQEVVVKSVNMDEMIDKFSSSVWDTSNLTYFGMLNTAITLWNEKTKHTNQVFNEPEVKHIISGLSDKVDIVVTTPISGQEVAYFLAHKLNATMVIWSAQQNTISFFDFAIGQPHNPALIGNVLTTFRHPMSFFQRVGNTLITFLVQTVRDYLYLPDFENVIDQHFPKFPRKDRPSLLELERKTALTIQFSHPRIMDGNRPLAQNYINVGMMHCRPGKPLPDHLQKFMDESGDDGVIFVSFGSTLKLKDMSKEQKNIMVDVFSRLKQRVIWKWETEMMEDKPDNVLLSKWLPQQDILAHPKLKLFVSHGGQSSCQESLCHKKPMVIIPIFGDQPANGVEAELKGYGLSFPLKKMTSEKLFSTIQKVLTDPAFTRRANEHGTLLMEDITKPLDRAVWWLEYALRYPGIKHLRSPSHELTWYQYLLLDVILFLILVSAAFCFLFHWMCCKFCCGRSKKKHSKSKLE